MFRVNIPSKGRAGKSKLLAENEGFTIFVEPQEYDEYVSCYPQHHVQNIGRNDKGVTYVRQHILMFNRLIGRSPFWVIDDDVTGFFLREGKKLIKAPMQDVLEAAEKQFEEAGTHLGALEYRHYSWCASKDLVSNRYCTVCVYIRNIDSIDYTDLACFSDQDFAMQCIRAGLNVHRTTLSAFSAPMEGTNAGGLHDLYNSRHSIREQACDRLVSIWGEHICRKVFIKDNRASIKINWDAIVSKQPSIKFNL